MKRILGILLVLTMVLSLLGCTSPDTELYKSLEKMQEVTSLDSETELSFELNGEGFEESEQVIVDQLALSLNSLKLLTKEKSLRNEEGTEAQSEAVVSVEFGGVKLDTKIWSDVNLNTGDMKNIIQLPAMLGGLMGPEVASKDYLVYDVRKIMELEDEDVNFDEMMELQKEFQIKIVELAKEIQKEFKPGFEIIELKEEKERAGEKIKVYEFKLDDGTFKELVKEFIDTSLENQGTREFIVDYMNLAMKMTPSNELNHKEIKEIQDGINDIEENLDEKVKKTQEEFHKFMGKIEDMKILGEEGVRVLYSVNSEGYIVETDGLIHLTLNFEKLAQAMEEVPIKKGILELKINYNTRNKNINSEDIKIEFPELTGKNSMDFSEIMEMEMGLPYGQ